MARLILLNGPPGLGKSTLAGDTWPSTPGVLNCDIDVLRTLIGGWETDFSGAGRRIRTAALALITAYLRDCGDVVLPQLVSKVDQVERFGDAAREAEADLVELMLMDDVDACFTRFHRRATDDASDRVKREVVERDGGEHALRRTHAALLEVADARPRTRVVRSQEGDVVGTYASVLAALDG